VPEPCGESQPHEAMRVVSDAKSDGSTSTLHPVQVQKNTIERSGSVVRRFPSVTVVDDRKGHWRSISLISAQSGKSLRNSTNDLLDLIKEAENQEREKLMKAVEEFGQELGVVG